MKINSITIANVKGVKTLMLSPEKINFITGPSGAGKSSVMEAIRYILTGKSCTDHMTIGTPISSVAADIDRLGIVERSVDATGKTKVRLNGKTTTAKSVMELCNKLFGVSLESLNLATSSELVKHALGKDLAAYLLNSGFLKNDMTFKRLIALNPLDADATKELAKVLPADPAVITLQDIDSAYQNFCSARPALKKMITSETALSAFEGAIPSLKSASIHAEIISAQTELAATKQRHDEYPKKLREAESLRKSIADAEDRLRAYDGVKPVTSKEKELTESNRTKATKLVEEVKLAIRSASADIKMYQTTLSALDTPVCPISKQLVCTTDKSAVRGEIEDAIALKEATLASLSSRQVDYTTELEKAQQACQNLLLQESNWKIKISLVDQLDKLKKISVIVPEKPNPRELLVIEKKLNELTEQFNYAKKYEDALVHAERLHALQHNLSVTETLVTELSASGGIRKQVLAHCIAPLEDWCNENMKIVLPQYKLRFNPDDSFAINMETTTGDTIAFESLSSGEQLRAIFIIMSMLNALNNSGIILLDDINAVDINTFEQFIKLLETVSGDYDHIFISGINHHGFIDAFDKISVPHMCVDLTK